MKPIRKIYLSVILLVVSTALGIEARAQIGPEHVHLVPVRVEFIQPNSACNYYKTETMPIRFRLVRLPGASIPRGATAVKLTIYDSRGLYHVPSVPFTGGHPLVASFWIPNNFRAGSALITANLEDGDGLVLTTTVGSTQFKVHENKSRIEARLVGTEPNGKVKVGGKVRIRYRVLKRVAPCKIVFSIKGPNSGEIVSSVVREYRPVSPNQKELFHSFEFPYTFNEAGEYRLLWGSTPPLIGEGVIRFKVVHPVQTLYPTLGTAR